MTDYDDNPTLDALPHEVSERILAALQLELAERDQALQDLTTQYPSYRQQIAAEVAALEQQTYDQVDIVAQRDDEEDDPRADRSLQGPRLPGPRRHGARLPGAPGGTSRSRSRDQGPQRRRSRIKTRASALRARVHDARAHAEHPGDRARSTRRASPSQGHPFVVMERVVGHDIVDRYCDERPSSTIAGPDRVVPAKSAATVQSRPREGRRCTGTSNHANVLVRRISTDDASSGARRLRPRARHRSPSLGSETERAGRARLRHARLHEPRAVPRQVQRGHRRAQRRLRARRAALPAAGGRRLPFDQRRSYASIGWQAMRKRIYGRGSASPPSLQGTIQARSDSLETAAHRAQAAPDVAALASCRATSTGSRSGRCTRSKRGPLRERYRELAEDLQRSSQPMSPCEARAACRSAYRLRKYVRRQSRHASSAYRALILGLLSVLHACTASSETRRGRFPCREDAELGICMAFDAATRHASNRGGELETEANDELWPVNVSTAPDDSQRPVRAAARTALESASRATSQLPQLLACAAPQIEGIVTLPARDAVRGKAAPPSICSQRVERWQRPETGLLARLDWREAESAKSILPGSNPSGCEKALA
jgi:hypothetical protein